MFRNQSVMTHQFSRVPSATIPRSVFDRSHGFKTTFDAGYLVPCFVDEVLPGDSVNLKMSMFARLATPIKPIMDNLFIDTFFFFVPNRLIWDNWQKFCGERKNPADSIDFLVPQMTSPDVTGYAIGSLSDYFGIPTGVPKLPHSALFHRSYSLIWNEWFRDQNLQDSVVVDTDDGPDSPTDYVLLRRGKRHDYFTSALPWPQKGDAVSIGLSGTAPVESTGQVFYFKGLTSGTESKVVANNSVGVTTLASIGNPNDVIWGPSGTGLRANLSAATAFTINAIRESFQIQKLLERDARGGTRYIEILKSHFGVTSPDARLQRPELLGYSSTPVNVHPIAQTSSTNEETPQGNLAAMGTAVSTRAGFTKSFVEHGIIIGLVSARADLTYQQGLERMFSRRTRYDYYWPAFSHLGEQAILNKEIMAQGNDVTNANGIIDNQVFGYQERYAEYRYKPAQITGKFRTSDAGTLDFWHLSQSFSSLPVLNSTFIQENPPMSRVIAVNTEPHFLFDAYYKIKSARPMPVYSVPGLIDHF